MCCRVLKIVIYLCVIAISATTVAYAQNREVDIKIHFPYDDSCIDITYMDNPSTLNFVDSLFRDSIYISTLRKIEVTAQSSPEGSVDYNERLSRRRIEALREYFTTNYPQIDSSVWLFNSVAENWELFHQHLVEECDIPYHEQVLEISSSNRGADEKERLLRSLNQGQSWLYIKEHILPLHRFGANVLLFPQLVDSPVAASSLFNSSVAFSQLEPSRQELAQVEISKYISPIGDDSQLLFALKSNLVLDLVSVVNLAVEIPIGERWSVVGEVVHPWWRSWPADFTMQIESYHAEVKYWLGDRSTKEQLQGWSVGAYGGWGRYDIQPFSKKGVQGSFFDAGAHIGFAHPIAKSLNLEYTIGFGYVSTSYNDYEMVNNSVEYGDIKVIPYPWINNTLKSILPTRCGVSLVWVINR